MNTLQEKRIRYETLEELARTLESRLDDMKVSEDNYLKRSANEETGEVDVNCWEYAEYTELCNREEVIRKIIKELEKM